MGVASLIAASGALLGALITTALWQPANRDTAANRQLALVALIVTLYQLGTVARHADGLPLLQPLRGLSIAIFVLGPALYWYTRARISDDTPWRRSDLWHLLPCAALLLDNVLSGIGLWSGTSLSERFHRLIGIALYLHLIGYTLAALWQLRRVRHQTTLAEAALRWLATLLRACLVLAVPGLVFALGRLVTDAISWPQQIWSITLTVGTSYLIAFFALMDPSVFHGSRAAREVAREQRDSARYQSSSLTAEQARELWQRLESLMREQQPYLQTQLKVGELARLLDVPASHLSQTINQVGGCSFATYLNGYRIDTARRLLSQSQPGERTMLDIALSAGFNSESVFYKNFRERVGQTPRQFQQQA